MVDEGSLEGEIARRVDGVVVVSGRFHRCLVDGQQIELRIVALVEEQLIALNYKI